MRFSKARFFAEKTMTLSLYFHCQEEADDLNLGENVRKNDGISVGFIFYHYIFCGGTD